MSRNDVVLLDNLLSEWRKNTAPAEMSESDSFELFSLEQVLKNYDLSTEDLLKGKTGGGNDGGIDGFFTFVNGDLLDEDTKLETTKRNPDLAVYMIQATETESFQETVFDKVSPTVRDLLDLTREQTELEDRYSDALLGCANIFRNALKTLTSHHPQVTVRFVLATKGSTASIHPKVRSKADDLRALFSEFLRSCSASADFAGARELLELARRQATYTLELRFIESPISVENSYIVLVTLSDYFKFITDNSGALRRYVFEWNVRDYQGNVEVNADIKHTLQDEQAPEFWWLNNGVTIIASKASITGKLIALDDVQIVNGLQTSVRIHEYVSQDPERKEARALLCRIIVTEDTLTRDRIIKATNFQTAVSAASLKATNQIQRDIEAYFLSNKWYYDRRKNYYKNLGRPADRIVSIPYLAQAVMAMGLGEPDNSRARPTSLIKRDEDYKRVFDEKVDLAIYHGAAVTMKKVDSFLRSGSAPGDEGEKREFRFHLAAWVVRRRLRRWPTEPADLASLVKSPVNGDELRPAMDELPQALRNFPKRSDWPLDRIAKSRDFVSHLRNM